MPDLGLYESFFRDAPELLVLLGTDRRVKAANPAFRATVRHGRDGVDFMDLVLKESRDRVLHQLVKAAGGAETTVQVPHAGEDGPRVVEYRFFPVEGGMVAGIGRPTADAALAALGRAQAELKEKSRILDEIQLELTQVPFIDPVTGVWNRLQVIERLTSEWSRSERYGSPIACLLVDVEGLDEIRRRDVPAVADDALKAVARRIKGVVRDHDIVGRYGGDQFVIVAVQSNGEGARSLADRIREAVHEEPVSAGGRTAKIVVRIGAATNRSDGVEILEDLFTVAATALADARAQGLAVHVVSDDAG